MIDAHIHRAAGEWFVTFTLDAAIVDEAGPFQEELEAIDAGIRGCTGELHPWGGP